MKVNQTLIQALRKQRSWSQDDLAAAAGLNLRTVQRIERSGDASLQSRRAIAAAFGIEGNELDSQEEAMPAQYEYRVVRYEVTWKSMGTKFEVDTQAIEDQMNALGAEGWDLVKMVELRGYGSVTTVESTVAFIATFKRVR
jgi:transcriptional regulator with XRE-family HTH domain